MLEFGQQTHFAGQRIPQFGLLSLYTEIGIEGNGAVALVRNKVSLAIGVCQVNEENGQHGV